MQGGSPLPGEGLMRVAGSVIRSEEQLWSLEMERLEGNTTDKSQRTREWLWGEQHTPATSWFNLSMGYI